MDKSFKSSSSKIGSSMFAIKIRNSFFPFIYKFIYKYFLSILFENEFGTTAKLFFNQNN